MRATLVWQRDLIFAAESGEARLTVDSDGLAGPSPMQTLAFSLAGCMGMDVVHVLRKGRHDLRGLRVTLLGERAQTEPRRFTGITLQFTAGGDVPLEALERAVRLSREKYCSVWHSLREDIQLTVTSGVSADAGTR